MVRPDLLETRKERVIEASSALGVATAAGSVEF